MTMPTILIVDDDPEITDALSRGLRMHGYDTRCARAVAGVPDQIADPAVTAAIIDVMIGADSGIALVRSLRASGVAKPLLMLSALAEVEDRAAGLEAGADDYIVKPFSFDELVARLKVQERRAAVPALSVDPTSRRLRCRGGQAVELTEREFELFEMLHDRAGEILSRGEIFDSLWAKEGSSSENVVDVYIGYLRRKLAALEESRLEIRTIRNRGFVLGPPFPAPRAGDT
ncbi:response regulator transcription factor [Oceaniglobus roseus]|uniref:response regulator transcription factor n=1 Tax=Oceaniglobus roseus TaxID=1737570 RepID=UPI000C7F679D|nr:response regulator transcription factor [Kandeliimicrobium roseum]